MLAVLLLSPAVISPAAAGPYVVGDRAFPATPTTEDPFVADEVFASVAQTRQRASGSEPAARETELEAGFAKRITADLGLSLEGGYTIEDPTGRPSAYGFDDLAATLKYQLVKSDAHEFLGSLGVTRVFGGTGAARVDADSVSATIPTVYFGKGFGDLPPPLRYLAPAAITGSFGYQISDRRSAARPDVIIAGGSIQYSLRYLEGNVRYLGLPEFAERMILIVEVAYTTPSSRADDATTIGTVAPGIIYTGNHFDLGIEALVPATRQAGTNVGFIASLHWRFGGALGRVLGDEP
jgi:hypothetical protein